MYWNYRRSKSGQIQREMMEIMREYKTFLVVLLEPKISGVMADDVCKTLGKIDGLGRRQRGLAEEFGCYEMKK